MSQRRLDNGRVTCTEQSSSLESQPLISPLSQPVSKTLCSPLRRLCITSKPVALILLLTVVVGSVHMLTEGAAIGALLGLSSLLNVDAILPFVITYCFIASVLVFYPINGFLADVYCGRRNAIFASLCFILCFCAGLFLVILPIYNRAITVSFVLFGFGSLIVNVGIAGYGANFIQFGLDQLLEAPSRDQALFVHWAKWCYDCFSGVFLMICVFDYCNVNRHWNFKWTMIFSIASVIIGIMLFVIAFSFWKHHWFYTEPRRHNPYKLVAKVLSFVWKHKYPLQRSAFTYCDDERPSRLDFAKEKFGGPFSTEQVEDVKILLRIVLILLAIGPVFSMDPFINNFGLAYIGLHVGSLNFQVLQNCSWEMFVTNAGILRYFVSEISFLAYMWIIFSLFRGRIPKMLTRIGCGMVIYFIGMLSLFTVDFVGHYAQKDMNATDCILHVYIVDGFPIMPSLGMHWSVMIPSAVFLGIGPWMVIATIFEFISAQSPHSVKGFLFGVFFAIRGTFQFLGSIVVFLFSSPIVWKSSVALEHPSSISCLSHSILFLCVSLLVSPILFLIAAKRYKHRERGDRPFDQRFAVDFYTRVIENRERDT